MSAFLWRARRGVLFSGRSYLPTAKLITRTSRGCPCMRYSTKSTSENPPSGVDEHYVEYGMIEYVEWPSAYRPDGYHPIHINATLHNRYRVVHKLGYGSCSTIWLALDHKTSKYVAVKVGVADSDKEEEKILSRLTKRALSSNRASDMPLLTPVVTDRFEIEGPNGTHPCIVRAPSSCSLRDAKRGGMGLFQLDVARSFAAQIVLAVAFVHSQGYCHGDLHLGNLLLQLPSSLDNLSIDQLYAEFGAPDPDPMERVDGKPYSTKPGVPSHVYAPGCFGRASEEITLSEGKIILNDFGVSFRPSHKTKPGSDANVPLVMRAPEAFFEPTAPLTLESDIWSLACLIFELVSSRSLFDGWIPIQDDIIAEQIQLSGPMPAEWWARWDNRSKYFDDEHGKPLCDERDIWTWQRCFDEWIVKVRQSTDLEYPDKEEWSALLELLQCMLAWKPTDRPSAEEVLGMIWMKKWALPAYELTKLGQNRSHPLIEFVPRCRTLQRYSAALA